MSPRVSKKEWAAREDARRAEEASFTAALGQRTEDRCLHPHKKRCGLCDENYCPNDGCDPYHVEGCRDARKP